MRGTSKKPSCERGTSHLRLLQRKIRLSPSLNPCMSLLQRTAIRIFPRVEHLFAPFDPTYRRCVGRPFVSAPTTVFIRPVMSRNRPRRTLETGFERCQALDGSFDLAQIVVPVDPRRTRNEPGGVMEFVKTATEPVYEFSKDSARLLKRCNKPDRRGAPRKNAQECPLERKKRQERKPGDECVSMRDGFFIE